MKAAPVARREAWDLPTRVFHWTLVTLALLAILLLQAVTGLFSDDESSHQGPLAAKVSNAVVDRMSVIHGWNGWVIAGAVALHVAAVLFYQWGLKVDLIRPMVAGQSDARLTWRAAILFAIACAAVYALVVVYSR